MSATAELDATPRAVLVPPGPPVRSGRLHVGRLGAISRRLARWRLLLGSGRRAGSATLTSSRPVSARWCSATKRLWMGGRVVLDREALAWLAVDDPAAFEAVVMPVPAGGLLVVSVEGFASRAR